MTLDYDHPDAFENKWKGFLNPELMKNFVADICENIFKKGEETRFNDVYDLLYEYVQENIDNFLGENDDEGN